jgi:hypothetical protein
MAKSIINLSDTIATLVSKTNQTVNRVGDVAQLTTVQDSSLVYAINEIDSALDSLNIARIIDLARVTTLEGQVDSNNTNFVSRVRNSISASGDLNYNPATGIITIDVTNIQDIVGAMVDSGNSESGITVTYQSVDGTIDFDVNDPTISLTGDITGSNTMTNLGNVAISTTLASGVITSSNFSSLETLTIKNEGGTILKTMYSPGS